MELLPFTLPGSEATTQRGVVLDIDEDETLGAVVPMLHHRHRHEFIGCRLIVVRPSIAKQREPAIQADERNAFRELAHRFPGTSIALLCSRNYVHQMSADLSIGGVPPFDLTSRSAGIISAIRQQEMEHFVQASDAVMLANQGFRYHLPSGVYSDAFLRVGNIQVSRHVLDAVFFWMIPFLSGVKGLLVETWSVSSIALNACRLFPLYSADDDRLRIEMLAHYLDGRPGTRSELVAIAKRVSNDFLDPFLILFSASMTGKALGKLSRSLRAAGCAPNRVRTLVMYRLGTRRISTSDGQIPELCDFSDRLRTQVEEPREVRRPANRATVEIDPKTYFPMIVHERELRILKKFALRNRRFFDRYRQSAVVRVHANAYVGGQRYRHHGFFVDVSEMLKIQAFVRRLKRLVLRLEPVPDVIIFPPHDAGEKIARVVRRTLRRRCENVRRFSSLDLSELTIEPFDEEDRQEKVNHLSERLRVCSVDGAIMVADDAITTGARMRTFQRRLREIGYQGKIHYFVAVARMESRSLWTDLQATLALNQAGTPHTVTAVDEVTLPDWDEEACSWCLEGHIFDDIIKVNSGTVSSAMSERATAIRNADRDGMTASAFMEGYKTPAMVLTPNSVFVNAPAVASVVAAAVASTVQEMRTEKDDSKRLSPGGYPVRSVLSIDDLERYTDPILRAAILRAAYAPELRRSEDNKENERVEWARRRLRSADMADRELRRELLLTVLMDKLPSETLDRETLDLLRREGFAEFCDLVEGDRL
jgi:hypothetical protein